MSMFFVLVFATFCGSLLAGIVWWLVASMFEGHN